MTKSKTVAALAALTLAGALTVASNQAQAHSHFGVGLGIGLAAGAVVGAAAASNAYAEPVYYRECHYVRRYDRWGNERLIKVCTAY